MMGGGMMGGGRGMRAARPAGAGPAVAAWLWPRRMGQGMMAIRTDAGTVEAGKVTFDVTNWSRNLIHEMLVVAVDNPNVQLPYDKRRPAHRRGQDQVARRDRGNAARRLQGLTLDLKPGTYLLVCNLPGHYAAGMWTVLTVTQ